MTPVFRTTAALAIVVLAAAAPVSAGSSADRATGGGQILVGTRGPGDTIAFQAQQRANGVVSGNVNVIDRVQGATGKGAHFRGDVTCLAVAGNTAKMAGVGRLQDGTQRGFTLIVTDNGEGAAANNDLITLEYTDDPTCEREDGDDDAAVELARGNAQVYDAP